MLDVAGLVLRIEQIWPLFQCTQFAHVSLDSRIIANTCKVVQMEDSRINTREASEDVGVVGPQIIEHMAFVTVDHFHELGTSH